MSDRARMCFRARARKAETEANNFFGLSVGFSGAGTGAGTKTHFGHGHEYFSIA